MALFNQSLKAVSAAITEIADSAGASADAEMVTRSYRSLQAAQEHWNTRADWDFLLTEASPISVFGPFNTSVTASAGQTSATLVTNHGVKPDDLVVNSAFTYPTRVATTAATSCTFNMPLLSNLTGTCETRRDLYDLPADFKKVYTVRLMTAQKFLRQIRRRQIERGTFDPFLASTPLSYDIIDVAKKGKIRPFSLPAGNDTLYLLYYRRMAIASASTDGTTLDIPQDYEPYLIAWAKWHFLTDKGEGRAEQAQVWITFAENGITTVLKDQTRLPDEDLSFFPGHYDYRDRGPNEVRHLLEDNP